jgi:hypothetical protein
MKTPRYARPDEQMKTPRYARPDEQMKTPRYARRLCLGRTAVR